MSSLVISIPTDGQPLPGELRRAATPAGILVVFAHGAGAGHRSPFIRRIAGLLAERGLDVLTFDFPYMAAGRKLPDRPPVLEAALHDAVAAGVAALDGQARAVAVAGKSMGGRMATHLAAQPEGWRCGVPLAAAVAFGYPLRPPGPRGGDRVSHLARLSVPTLVVQGTRDTFGGPDDVRAATTNAPRVRVFPVETGDHSLKVTAASGQRQEAVESAIADAVAAFAREAASATPE
ncbi:MAG: alpha/beta fold hydrolase [Acidobacteria bacterium]|nr:alpha/beta fold hydrolase [Acidobacteriota bacterium]